MKTVSLCGHRVCDENVHGICRRCRGRVHSKTLRKHAHVAKNGITMAKAMLKRLGI